MVEFLVGFTCMLAGIAIGTIGVTYFMMKSFKDGVAGFYNEHKAFFDHVMTPPRDETKPPKQLDLNASVIVRLRQAGAIAQQQADITGSLNRPSAGAAHSKHKNNLIKQYKALEEEKLTLLRSILKDGFDPDITVFNAATQQQEMMRLSSFLNNPEVTPPATTTDSNDSTDGTNGRKVEKNGRTFIIYDGGKKNTSH